MYNRKTDKMETRLLTFFTILLWTQMALFSQASSDILIGQRIQYDSEIYGRSKELLISLPSDYQDSLKSYPVLYVLFPRYTFERARSAAGYLEGTNGIPGLIVVGICSEDSWNETFPFRIERIPTSGGGDRFMNFIGREVIPFTESKYRTDSLRILAGFSNSAMFASYLMMHEPDLFDSFILSSPMLGWGDNYVLNEMIEFFSKIRSFDKTYYAVYGDLDYKKVVSTMPLLESLLKEKAPENFRWKIDLLEDEHHVPYIDLYEGLIYTFEELNKK